MTLPSTIKGAFEELQIVHTHTLHLLYLTHVEMEKETSRQAYNLERFTDHPATSLALVIAHSTP